MDEADRLLDLGTVNTDPGFEKDLSSIISKLPKQRRTGLFSATMTEGLSRLIKAGLRNPVRVHVKVQGFDGVTMRERKVPEALEVWYVVCEAEQKLAECVSRLEGREGKCMLYFSTGAAVDFFFKV